MSPNQDSVIDSIPELNLNNMNQLELANVGQQILNQNNEDVRNDLQKLINKIKESTDDHENTDHQE